MKKTRNQVPLIIEPHPDNYTGYRFLTLIKYNKQKMLTVIDEITDKELHAYVLDFCGPENVDEQIILTAAENAFDEATKRNIPMSVLISRAGLTPILAPIHRTFNLDFITRVIGPVPKMEVEGKPSIRRRKRKDIPDYIEVVYRSTH